MRGPYTDAFYLRDVLDDLLARHLLESFLIYRPVDALLREVFDVGELLWRETGGAQLLIGRSQHERGRGLVVGIERLHPREDRGGRFAGDLLIHNGAQERREYI